MKKRANNGQRTDLEAGRMEIFQWKFLIAHDDDRTMPKHTWMESFHIMQSYGLEPKENILPRIALRFASWSVNDAHREAYQLCLVHLNIYSLDFD